MDFDVDVDVIIVIDTANATGTQKLIQIHNKLHTVADPSRFFVIIVPISQVMLCFSRPLLEIGIGLTRQTFKDSQHYIGCNADKLANLGVTLQIPGYMWSRINLNRTQDLLNQIEAVLCGHCVIDTQARSVNIS